METKGYNGTSEVMCLAAVWNWIGPVWLSRAAPQLDVIRVGCLKEQVY